VSAIRSSASITLATITPGIANRIINDVMRMAQTNNGMRGSDMPGARCLMIVATSSTAATSADTSTKVMIVVYTSMRAPGEYARPESVG
jgi:hypothetical protein